MSRIKVLVDTDIGNDPDDALALAYLARHPLCELVGITTVTGNVQQRAAIAEVVLQKAGHVFIPIHCGRESPLCKGIGQPTVMQYATIQHLPHQTSRPANTAVDFMRKTIRENPGEIVLLSIGPMSNLALLFALDPETPGLCRDVVSMAGKFFGEGKLKEWNVLVDETASGMVLKSKRPRHRFAGLDATRKCTLHGAAEVEARFEGLGELGDFLKILVQEWLRIKGRITLHDPLAAAAIFRPELCEWKKGKVVVDERNGATSFEEGEGDDFVAADVDADFFFDHYFKILAGSDRTN